MISRVTFVGFDQWFCIESTKSMQVRWLTGPHSWRTNCSNCLTFKGLRSMTALPTTSHMCSMVFRSGKQDGYGSRGILCLVNTSNIVIIMTLLCWNWHWMKLLYFVTFESVGFHIKHVIVSTSLIQFISNFNTYNLKQFLYYV